jgi:hypothetical protein
MIATMTTGTQRETTSCPGHSHGPARLPCVNPEPHDVGHGCVYVGQQYGLDREDDET